jgi:hypothetical protein
VRNSHPSVAPTKVRNRPDHSRPWPLNRALRRPPRPDRFVRSDETRARACQSFAPVGDLRRFPSEPPWIPLHPAQAASETTSRQPRRRRQRSRRKTAFFALASAAQCSKEGPNVLAGRECSIILPSAKCGAGPQKAIMNSGLCAPANLDVRGFPALDEDLSRSAKSAAVWLRSVAGRPIRPVPASSAKVVRYSSTARWGSQYRSCYTNPPPRRRLARRRSRGCPRRRPGTESTRQ